MNQILIAGKIIAVVYLITRFEPLWNGINLLTKSKRWAIRNGAKLINKFNCSKCLTFWATFIGTRNIYIAIGAMIIMNFYEMRLSWWEKNYKL